MANTFIKLLVFLLNAMETCYLNVGYIRISIPRILPQFPGKSDTFYLAVLFEDCLNEITLKVSKFCALAQLIRNRCSNPFINCLVLLKLVFNGAKFVLFHMFYLCLAYALRLADLGL